MKIRQFQSNDVSSMIDLFRQTVHHVCTPDYTQEQLDAWAPEMIDSVRWNQRFLESYTIVAEDADGIIGFANLEDSGCIDMLYVHAHRQGQGIARALYENIVKEAVRLGVKNLTSDVSITAQPFFLKMGFKINQTIIKEVRGVVFNNALMSKSLVSLFNSDRHK